MSGELTDKRLMIKEIAKHFGDNPIVGVEVGCSFGRNSESILAQLDNLTTLHLIDSFPTYHDFNDNNIQITNKQHLLDNFTDNPRTNIILKTSVEASKEFKDKSVDFVYIDAQHTYDEVKEDILTWLPKVKDGGMIGGHDYDYLDPLTNIRSVKKAVDELFGKKDVEKGMFIYSINMDTFLCFFTCDWWKFV